MRYILIILLFPKTFICFSQSDTIKDDCEEAGIFMLPYFCPSCEVLPDSLPAVLAIKKVTVSSKVDSTISRELDLTYALLDSLVYIIKAKKADCTLKIDEIDYYDKSSFLYKRERELGSLHDKKLFYRTIYTRDEKGRELTYTNYADTIREDYGESMYDKKGKLLKHIFYSKLLDFNDTIQFKYDKFNRLRTKIEKGILGGKQREESVYSKDGSVSVTKLYSEGSDHGSLMDSTFYNNRHQIIKRITPQRGEGYDIVSYQYDNSSRPSAVISWQTDRVGEISDKYVFHYRPDSLIDHIEHYTSQRKATISYQYEY